MPQTHQNQFAYQQGTIEFVTVSAQLCRLLENLPDRATLMRQLKVILPLLYIKGQLVECPSDTVDAYLEQFVFEADYESLRLQLQTLLGEHDAFLDSFHPDMAFTPEPPAAEISEYLADIYQELKDMAGNFQTGDEDIMTCAVVAAIEAMRQHWGRKLLSALAALNAIEDTDNEDENKSGDEDEEENGNDANMFDKIFNHNK